MPNGNDYVTVGALQSGLIITMVKKKKVKEPVDYSGFVLTFEPKRTQWLAERLNAGKDLNESFSGVDWTFERRELVLLVLTSSPLAISAVALMERMHGSGGSGKPKMRMSKTVILPTPILESEITVAALNSLVSTPETLKRLDPQSWKKLLFEICTLRPEVAKEINELISLREKEIRILGETEKIARLNEQRDGLGLALDIAQIPRGPVMSSMDTEKIDTATSILDLLNFIPVQERSLIEHDSKIFEEILEPQEYRSAIFSDDSGRSVRTYVVDKDNLETVLGIDLIIYSICYENYLLIQYKRMEKESSGWAYHIKPSSNLHSQLSSMERFRRTATSVVNNITPNLWSYRLNGEPFYFKFCEQFRPNGRDESLVPGITLSESHLREFLELPEARGPSGGVSIGYKNCPRYLNNTEFVQLARVGWIGSGIQSVALLKQVLEANRKGGRAAMLAVVDIPRGKSAASRGRKK